VVCQDHIASLNFNYKVQLRSAKVTYHNAYAEFIGPHRIKVLATGLQLVAAADNMFLLKFLNKSFVVLMLGMLGGCQLVSNSTSKSESPTRHPQVNLSPTQLGTAR